MLLKLSGNIASKQGYDAKPCEVVDIHYREDGPKWIVLKEPGEHYWAARGTQGYSPARYAVHAIQELLPDGRIRIDNVSILDWPVRFTNKDEADLVTKMGAWLKFPQPV